MDMPAAICWQIPSFCPTDPEAFGRVMVKRGDGQAGGRGGAWRSPELLLPDETGWLLEPDNADRWPPRRPGDGVAVAGARRLAQRAMATRANFSKEQMCARPSRSMAKYCGKPPAWHART
jgi:hypothetical protein